MPGRVHLFLITTSILVLGLAGAAQGAITVTNTNDSGPGSLRQAVEAAPPGETVVVPAGTYTLTSGEIKAKDTVRVEGAGAEQTVVSGGGKSGVFYSVGEQTLTLAKMTIRDGRLDESIASGAGVYSSGADLVLQQVVVTNNVADGSGAPSDPGGIVEGGGVYSVGGTLTISDSKIIGNQALADGGSEKPGGIVAGGGVYSSGGSVSISNSTISGNLASGRGGSGPASSKQPGGIVDGGGLHAVLGAPDSVSITGSTFSGNSVDGSGGPGSTAGIVEGGGIYVSTSDAPIAIERSTLVGNSVVANGTGGISGGGGMMLRHGAEGLGRIQAATISANRIEAPAEPEPRGGNLFITGKWQLAGSIVSGGLLGSAADNCHFFGEEVLSAGFNIDSSDQCGFHAAGDKVNTDPLLGPLQDNGGPAPTMLPTASSPAVDQGNALGLAADARGVIRPIDFPSIPNAAGGDGSDIGAAELQPSNAVGLGKLKKNKKKGTATLELTLPQPSAGSVVLEGKGLKTQTAVVTGQATLKLKVAATGKAAKKLRKKGKRKVRIKVTYTPTGNAAATAVRKAKLVKKKRKHKRHKPKKASKR